MPTYRKEIQFVTGTKSSSGDNTALIAAPGAGYRIIIASIVLQNESANATTLILKSGTTAFWRVLAQAQGDGLALQFDSSLEWRLGANEALVLNLSGANSCGYSVAYYVEAVS